MTSAYQQLAAMTKGELAELFAQGEDVTVDTLLGWEFRGYNHSPRVVDVLRIRTFVKGFVRLPSGRPVGYNTPVVQEGLRGSWTPRTRRGEPLRARFFDIRAVTDDDRGRLAGGAGLVLDYGSAGNPWWEIARGLRDCVRRPRGMPDHLLLCKAYFRLPGTLLHLNYFLLERGDEIPEPVAAAIGRRLDAGHRR